ncbi:class I SAM-dependent RNA methyltransferase [Nocardioides marmotae]|uniref:class I SAM-dependent RNA methyltransferase n=1 Tax=Nocardioides marmotae TaxID=2663857 RepID=UPI0012B5E880|nr:class I SAM-dependent RNA methyltransferase [Nocardioides marmotae]MBC9731949.1 class I SAM-dependent RNA methyltransferase [Nocardioides marmotae]MTB83070.1 class I SAM-dependent RNA methyltransferase [Nocardioides marmotae]
MSPRPPQRRGRPAPRQRQARGASVVGRRYEAVVGPVAHGGHCIVRVPTDPTGASEETRVVFARHGIPGERVLLELTEGTEGDRFWRGDVVEVLEASPDRVVPPCPFAGPGRCGGCDFQHVDLGRQRALKAEVVAEQLRRLAGLDLPVTVEAVEGDLPEQLAGLRWRTRQQYVRLPDGRRGLRKHRSREVVVVDDCRIAHPDAREPGPGTVTEQVVGPTSTQSFEVAADGFWQVHPGAPRVLVDTVLGLLQPQPGESVLDLYAGVGLFARFLGEAVGETGRVAAIEGDPTAAGHAETNCPGAEVTAGGVDEVLAATYDGAWDLVVLDPPREGARRPVVEQVVARTPRAVAYVACDPAALARDVAIFAEHGYRLTALRAFDLFPMTHHVECVALLTKTGSDLR